MSIEKRHLVTGALLAFVAVTGITLAVKETRHARAVAVSESSRSAEPSTPVAEPVSAATVAPPPEAVAEPVEPPTTRPPTARPPAPAAAAPAVPPPAPAEPPATVLVTYFHTTARCMSCLKIEDLTNATMSTRFAGPIAEKRIVWRSLNLDEPANAHFVKDYGLYTKSVVVSEVRDGREVRWKNLEKVWDLLGDADGFQAYVEREVRAFLEKA